MGREVIQMKLSKNKLYKLCKVIWNDAQTKSSEVLSDFIKDAFAEKVSVGWLVYFDNEKLILCPERITTQDFNVNMFGDFTAVPIKWIKEITFIKEKTDG